MSDDLSPVEPRTALEMYLDDRRAELSDSTLYSHDKRLSKFCDWCDEQGVENLNDVTGRDVHEYKKWRMNGEKVDKVAADTIRTALVTVRRFMKWAASIDAVSPELPDRIVVPDYAARSAKSEMLSPDRAAAILDHLAKYRYASSEHVTILLLWRTGMRLGALLSLDVGDYDSDAPSLSLRHRPETGTTLKNGVDGERIVAISSGTAAVIDDYLDGSRHDATDDHGRDPLLTTVHGRRSRTATRNMLYAWTRPCHIDVECPSGEDPGSCEANTWAAAGDCPHSVSPHPVRRAAITHHLREDTPETVVSDRMDVSPGVIDEHYDERSEIQKMETRRDHLPGF